MRKTSNHHLKQILAVCLTVLMLLSVAPLGAMSDVLPKLDLDFDFGVTAHAEGSTPYLTSGYCGDTSDGKDGTDIVWTLDSDGTLTLTGTGEMTNTSPFMNDLRIKSVILPNGLTNIGEKAFYGCQNLKNIVIPDTVTSIGAYAFFQCSFSIITLPNSIVEIREGAFCRSALSEIVIPNQVTDIADLTFSNCFFLNSVQVPDSVKTLGKEAFYGCKALKHIDLPDSVETIGEGCFRMSFSGQGWGLESFVFPPLVTEIKKDTFYGSSLKNIVIPDRITTIGASAFEGCPIDTLSIGAGITDIPYNAFSSSYATIKSLVIPDTVQTVSSIEIKSLEEVYIGSGVQSFAFPSNKDLAITISENNPYFVVFDNIIYTKDYSQIVWLYRGRTGALIIPKELQNESVVAGLGGTGITEYRVEEGNPAFKSVNGIVYSFDGKKLLKCPHNYGQAVTIPETVNVIGMSAFAGCRILSVNIPSSLTLIDRQAFLGVDIESRTILLNEGLRQINTLAFSGAGIDSITIPDSVTSIGAAVISQSSIMSVYVGAGVNQNQLGGLSSFGTPCEEYVVSPDNPYIASYGGVIYTKDLKEQLLFPSRQAMLIIPREAEILNFPPISTYACAKVSVEEDNVLYASENNMLFNKEMTELLFVPNIGTCEKAIVPDGVMKVGNAFHDHNNIIEIQLPESVTDLGSFYSNSLTKINIPSKIRTVAISGCGNLSSVALSEGLEEISVGGTMTKLQSLCLPSTVKKITLGRHVAISDLTVKNRYCNIENIGNFPSNGSVTGFCGSTAHEMAVKRLGVFTSLGHTWLNWYVAEPATFEHDGLEKRDCVYCGESETRVIPKLEQETFTATFVADGKVVASVDYQKGTTAIDEPAVPARDRYTGKWEDYTLNDADLTINAVYSLIKSDDAQEIETDSTIEHYTEKDNILFRVKATSAAKIVKSVVSQSIPLDIVLVVDQSGSMEDTLGGSTKKVDALKEAANSFIASVAENARLTGANHRIAIAGFGLAGTYSGYQPYENTELLTGANGTVNYLNVTPADYASALLPVLNGAETNAALTSAVAAIEARGATAADLGLEMAKGIFANTDSTGRDRVVVFMTDGEPTYQSSFQKEVANNAVYNASLLKNAYDALVYSVGIFGQSESENRKIKSFMNAVSSNYPGAKTYTNLGASASDVFSITASHTDALNGVFKTITTESLSHTVPFENVTLIKTLAPCVTLTAPQEETLRIDVIRKYGISNDQIHITRDDQGRTEIRIDGLTPYEVTDKDGNVSYEVAIEFFAALNEHASAAGDYTVDTEDSGIMLGDDALGYEATFDTNSLNLSAQKTRYIFTINGEIYEIAEGSTVAAAVPETDFAADWQFSGWNTTGVSNANGTIIDATLVKAPRTVTWHTADGDTTQVYTEGQFLNPPEVPDRADGSKFLSWDKSLPTVMLDRDLEFTAVYGPHIHRYVSELTKKATCTEDGLLTYTCICGDSYTEPVTATGHNYEAITATGDSDPTRCTFVCTNCGDKYEYALNYKVEDRSFWGSRTVYEFALTDDNLETGMQPDGSIDVRIPLNEFQSTATRVKVQRYVNGKWETVPAALEDGYLVITADHFTPYEVQFTFSCNETGEHTWNQGKETKAATCTEEGEMTYTCETCESTKTEPIGKKDHTPGAWIVDKAATCKEAGSKHQECTVCHNTIATETIAVDKTNHASYGTTLKNKVDANCTTKGYTGDAVCKGCGTVINKGNETAALGHTAPNSKGNCDRCGTHLKDVDSGSSTPAGACKYCGQVHTGPFGWLIKFFHSILALFGLHK